MDETGIWSSLLRSVNRRSRVSESSMYLLGDSMQDMDNIVAVLKGEELKNENKDSEISTNEVSFHHMSTAHPSLADPDSSDNSRVSIRCLSHADYSDVMLESMVCNFGSPETEGVLFGIVLNAADLPSLDDALHRWLEVMKRVLDATHAALPKNKQDDMKTSIRRAERYLKGYKEPADDIEVSIRRPNVVVSAGGGEGTGDATGNGFGTDTDNSTGSLSCTQLDSIYGVPLLIIVTNSEHIEDENLKKTYDLSQLEYLQYHLRSVCLQYGAGLVFQSTIHDINCLELHEYMLHRLYPQVYSYPHKAYSNVPASIFIPAGWDSPGMSATLELGSSGKWTTTSSYSSVIPTLEADTLATTKKNLITDKADEDAMFLQKMHRMLSMFALTDNKIKGGRKKTSGGKGKNVTSSSTRNRGTSFTATSSSGSSTSAIISRIPANRGSRDKKTGGASAIFQSGEGSGKTTGTATGTADTKAIKSFFNNLLKSSGSSSGTSKKGNDSRKPASTTKTSTGRVTRSIAKAKTSATTTTTTSTNTSSTSDE